MALLVAKLPFWEGASKGALLSVIPKSCFLLKNRFFIVFSAKHSFAEIKECNLKKQKFTKNRGCLPTCKKVFFLFVFCCLVVLFFLCAFCLDKKKQKGSFPAILEFFLFPQKACL